ncbi:ATPase family associated with various cellular activities (AAA) [uncultured archaeon]|nr:ATPase family associated with various cellular activities (AAA) [uncultured archaeon]
MVGGKSLWDSVSDKDTKKKDKEPEKDKGKVSEIKSLLGDDNSPRFSIKSGGDDRQALLYETYNNIQGIVTGIRQEAAKVIIGQDDVLEQMLIAIFCDSHALLEGFPGLGKTLTVRTLSSIMDLKFRRIQCTPDLMPSDVMGTYIVDADSSGRKSFRFEEGPVFTNVLLADEINRATPKSQSSLLEAMQERQVTVGNESRKLDKPFFVLATQNPIEMEGTYPLPEAQVDRFLLKIMVKYPTFEDEDLIVSRYAMG